MTTFMTNDEAVSHALLQQGLSSAAIAQCLDAIKHNVSTATLHERGDRLRVEASLAWERRVFHLKLTAGTLNRQRQLEAFLQAALAILTSGRYMTMDEAQMTEVLVMSGRGEEVLKGWSCIEL